MDSNIQPQYSQTPQVHDPTARLLENLLEKADLFVQVKKYQADKEAEVAFEEIKLEAKKIDEAAKLDLRNKIFAGAIILFCLVAYLTLTYWGKSTSELNIIISALITASIAGAFNYLNKKPKEDGNKD